MMLAWPHPLLRNGVWPRVTTMVDELFQFIFSVQIIIRTYKFAPSRNNGHSLSINRQILGIILGHIGIVASFPGSSRARTKNRKERGEPGKIYHVRNVIGRENLITCGVTNELAHAVWTEYIRLVVLALWPTGWD